MIDIRRLFAHYTFIKCETEEEFSIILNVARKHKRLLLWQRPIDDDYKSIQLPLYLSLSNNSIRAESNTFMNILSFKDVLLNDTELLKFVME